MDRQAVMAVWLVLLRPIAITGGWGLQAVPLYGATDKSLNSSLPVNFNCPFGQIYGFWLAIKLTSLKRTPQFKQFHLTASLLLLTIIEPLSFFRPVYVTALDMDLLLIGIYSDRYHTVRSHKLVSCALPVSLYCWFVGCVTTESTYYLPFSTMLLLLLKAPG